MLQGLRPGGTVLDLQVIRPNPGVEVDGRFVCEIDGEPLFRKADAATTAVDARVAAGDLVEEAVDDHEVRQHFPNGAELVEHVAQSARSLPENRRTSRSRSCSRAAHRSRSSSVAPVHTPAST